MMPGLGVEVSLDAVINQGYKTRCNDDTMLVRYDRKTTTGNLLGNIGECLEHALVGDPHGAWRHPSTSPFLVAYLRR